jgi:hypothetical protein
VPINAAPESPRRPVYSIPDFDEPEPGRSLVACGTVIGARVVDVVEVVDVDDVDESGVVVTGAIVVSEGTYLFGSS